MAHEDLTREQHAEGSSDRVFGLVFAAAFLVIAAWPLLHGETLRWWASGVAAALALIAVCKPALLGGLNRLWIKLGIVLGKVVSPIALAVLFYGVLTPVGALKQDPGAQSYWMPREPPGPPPDSMTNQF